MFLSQCAQRMLWLLLVIFVGLRAESQTPLETALNGAHDFRNLGTEFMVDVPVKYAPNWNTPRGQPSGRRQLAGLAGFRTLGWKRGKSPSCPRHIYENSSH